MRGVATRPTFARAARLDVVAEQLTCPICTLSDIALTDDAAECITCGHEWTVSLDDAPREVRDANGNLLANGDSVTLIKDLKLKGKSDVIKVGTKVHKIRLISGDHEIDCKVDGRGILLKAQYVKKA